MKDLNKQVGDTIRRIREQQGLTQEDFAEASGIHDKYVGRIERGTHGITLEYLCKAAKGLNMSITELVRQVFDDGETEENKKKILNGIQAVLKTQPIDTLKPLRKLISQFILSRSTKKSIYLLEARLEKKKKDNIIILTKKM